MTKKITFLGALLMAIVVTSYSVSGTYAKYISKIDIADEARVAKWEISGVDKNGTITSGQSIDLFKSSYEYGSNGTVVSASTDVVAPGTQGQYSFKLTGNVETNHTIKITTADSINNVVLDNGYNPLKFYVAANNTDASTITGWYDFATLLTELQDLYSGTANKVYAPGAVDNTEYTIFWKWDFNDADDAVSANDTKLGENSANHNVTLSIRVTAEQTQAPVTP